MYEVWDDDRLVYESESYRDAYEVAGVYRVVLWLVDRARSVCTPLPWTG